MFQNALAILFVGAGAAWFSWDAWMGLTRGVVYAFYVGTVDRTKNPVLFRFYLVSCLVIGVGLLGGADRQRGARPHGSRRLNAAFAWPIEVRWQRGRSAAPARVCPATQSA
jgi:hypothetical protein